VTITSGGALEASVKYLPFGGTRPGGSVPTEVKFTGQRLDGTGLYYHGARYYDPGIGRFVSPDSVIQAPNNSQSLNRYSYVINNPLAYTDPTGNCWGRARNLPGCGVARNTVEKVKELAVDTGKAVADGGKAAASAAVDTGKAVTAAVVSGQEARVAGDTAMAEAYQAMGSQIADAAGGAARFSALELGRIDLQQGDARPSLELVKAASGGFTDVSNSPVLAPFALPADQQIIIGQMVVVGANVLLGISEPQAEVGLLAFELATFFYPEADDEVQSFLQNTIEEFDGYYENDDPWSD